MSHAEYNHFLASIASLSPDQMAQLRRELDCRIAESATLGEAAMTSDQIADQNCQRKLFEAGLLSEIKPPIRDLTAYRDRKAVPILGEPLSESVLRDRR